MTPEQLSTAIVGALTDLLEAGALNLPDGVPASVVVERPKNRDHGDYATNVALQLAKKAGLKPRDLAGLLAERLEKVDGIGAVDIAGPGFLNVTVAEGTQGRVAADIVVAGSEYGHTKTLAGQRINVEFISANPTGPLHLGHTRWAVVGDAIARVLAAAGAEVTREFYINDRGNQMDLFGASIEAAALGEPIPEDGYQGDYIKTLAERIVARQPDILDLPDDERRVAFREAGYELQLKEQQEQLEKFHTHFDVWFSATRGTSSTPTARCGCAPPTSATTRTGCSSGATVSSPTSPATPPTTSTSASAASTAASTSSARTTTGTSAGSRPWQRARVTTPTRRSRC